MFFYVLYNTILLEFLVTFLMASLHSKTLPKYSTINISLNIDFLH